MKRCTQSVLAIAAFALLGACAPEEAEEPIAGDPPGREVELEEAPVIGAEEGTLPEGAPLPPPSEEDELP